MSAVKRLAPTSEEEYLRGELSSPTKHEYVDGYVYAMGWARNVHNLVKGNVFGRLFMRLLGTPCQPYDSDTKIRVRRSPRRKRFYYPDVSVICDPNPQDDQFQDKPRLITEVLSRKTRRIDLGEKRDDYLTIPSLSVYLLVETEFPCVIVWRRTGDDFAQEVYEGRDATIPLPELGTGLPLAEIYDGVICGPEPTEPEIE
jgi:Uma2 family endonuclease